MAAGNTTKNTEGKGQQQARSVLDNGNSKRRTLGSTVTIARRKISTNGKSGSLENDEERRKKRTAPDKERSEKQLSAREERQEAQRRHKHGNGNTEEE